MNRMKTMMLLAALTALLVWGGQAIGGKNGLVLALMMAGIMNIAAYWFSDRIVLRMHNAKPVSENDASELTNVVRELAVRAEIPTPKVYVIAEEAPNAFATGRNPENAAVAVTEGLLQILNKEELKGVIAHELGHVKNRDTLIMTIAATLGGALSSLANMMMWSHMLGGGRSSDNDEGHHPLAGLVGIIVAPIAALMIQSAISRTREFLADEAGAHLSGNPLALASALAKIESWSKKVPLESAAPATAHMFIINPLVGGGLARLFSTHPATQERIKRLHQLSTGVTVYA